jgi:cytochrome c-type biogenesis protein CcmE
MSSKAIRVVVSVVVISAALGALMYATLGDSTEYYKHVDEVTSNPQVWYGKNLQLHGYAAAIMRKPDTMDWRFDLTNNGATVHAVYTGIVPDTFKDGAEVVLKGRLDASGFHVVKDGVEAKCPSRYVAGSAGGAGTR